MDGTILNYLNQDFVDRVNQHAEARAAARAEAARIAAEQAAKEAAEAQSNDFASVLENAASETGSTSSPVVCPENLAEVFTEASNTYGVSEKLLICMAKAESNFNPAAVSSAGAMGIMQLMPATASALGVANAFDARENIMGGACLMAQHLQKYQGNVSLALAAYNAGSGAVDQYGGIPPYAETQSYVQKILGYMDTEITVPAYTGGAYDTTASTPSGNASAGTSANPYSDAAADTASLDALSALTGEDRDRANAAIESYFASQNISLAKLQKLILAIRAEEDGEPQDTASAEALTQDTAGQKQFEVTVSQGIDNDTAL